MYIACYVPTMYKFLNGLIQNEEITGGVPWIALTATACPKVVEDITKQINLSSGLKTFKLPSFRSNLFYDVRFRDCIDEPYEDLKEFLVSSLGEGEEKRVSSTGILNLCMVAI